MPRNKTVIGLHLSSIARLFSFPKENKQLYRALDKLLGFKPTHYEPYESALLHSSASHNNKKGLKEHNERLEFLGDSVLDLVVADMLYRKYPQRDEGELTKLRSLVVNRVQLNKVSTKLGLDKLIVGNFNRNILPEDVKGNALEALIGAIFLDKGFAVAYRFIQQNIFDGTVHVREIMADNRDHKSELFMWAQKNKANLNFETVGEIGKGEKKKYIINVIIDEKVMGTGEGSSKKKAQQNAAKNACKKLNLSSKIKEV